MSLGGRRSKWGRKVTSPLLPKHFDNIYVYFDYLKLCCSI